MQFRVPQYKTDMNVLELVQQKVGKMTKGLEHLFYEKQLRELLFGEQKAQGNLIPMCTNT